MHLIYIHIDQAFYLIAPIPTYFISTSDDFKILPDINGKQYGNDITYLGRAGIQTILGFKVGYYSINEKDDEAIEKFKEYSENESFKGIDILLTNEWPKNLTSNIRDSVTGPSSLMILDHVGKEAIAEVVSLLCPRYHFASSSSNVYFERQPYKNDEHKLSDVHSGKKWHVTRFVGLGEAFNDKKQKVFINFASYQLIFLIHLIKYMYAFNALPSEETPEQDLYVIPKNTTSSPFANKDIINKKRKFEELEKEEEERYQQSKQPPQYDRFISSGDNKSMKKSENTHPLLQRTVGCWFCLSNPDIEKHLIISIGKEVYLTLAKGAITPHHILIIPIEHQSSIYGSYKKLEIEVNEYKKALVDCFSKLKQSVVFWDRSMVGFHSEDRLHAHLQAIPIPKDQEENLIKIIEQVTEKENMQIVHLKKNVRVNYPYVHFEIPNVVSILVRSDKKGRGLLQFGRKVVSILLGVPEKEDWKNCASSKDIETKHTNDFKEIFKNFNPMNGE